MAYQLMTYQLMPVGPSQIAAGLPTRTSLAGRLQQLHQQLLADEELWQVLLARVAQQVHASRWWSSWQRAVAFSPRWLFSHGTLYGARAVGGRGADSFCVTS